LLKHGIIKVRRRSMKHWKLTMEKQHEVNKAPDMCPCGEHHGLSCPRRKLVLWQQKLANITL
jgi:hypothetical protein